MLGLEGKLSPVGTVMRNGQLSPKCPTGRVGSLTLCLDGQAVLKVLCSLQHALCSPRKGSLVWGGRIKAVTRQSSGSAQPHRFWHFPSCLQGQLEEEP